VRKYLKEHPPDGSILVHCSNGGGRSGVFIAVDSCMDMVKSDQSIDIFGFCRKMNNERMGLVESVVCCGLLGHEGNVPPFRSNTRSYTTCCVRRSSARQSR
jgi:hypothetical protein